MIEAIGLHKKFDDFVAVEDVNLQIKKGELVALLGPNGAGKTTTIRMLCGVLQPTSGRAIVNGYDIVTQAAEIRRSIGVLTEQPGLYLRMTGLEYLMFFGQLYGLEKEACRVRSLQLLDRFAMPNTAQRRIGEYSKGMKQKVGIIRAMLHNPAVLMLDEPTSAMDPYSAKLVRDAITELRNDNRAIILCTHNLTEAENLADRIAIIRAGKLIATGNVPSLKRQLLGVPRLEIEVDRPLNGGIPELEQLIEIDYIRDNLIGYRTEQPQQINPQIVRKLTELGIGVVGLREVSQKLEELYLSVVTGAA